MDVLFEGVDGDRYRVIVGLRKLLTPRLFARWLGEVSEVRDYRCLDSVGNLFVVPDSVPAFLMPVLERVCRETVHELRRKPRLVRTPWGYVRCVRRVLPFSGDFWLVEDCRLLGDRIDAEGLGEWLNEHMGSVPIRFSIACRVVLV